MKRNCSEASGFTLIELMLTIALVSILMVIATPNFIEFQRNAALTSFTNTLFSAINAARGEAMKRGRYAMVVPQVGNDWTSGWIVFVDVDRDRLYTATDDVAILTSEAVPSFVSVRGTNGSTAATPPYLMFDASGYAKNKADAFASSTLEIRRTDVTEESELLTQTRRVKIDPTGQMRVCKPKTITDTQCPV